MRTTAHGLCRQFSEVHRAHYTGIPMSRVEELIVRSGYDTIPLVGRSKTMPTWEVTFELSELMTLGVDVQSPESSRHVLVTGSTRGIGRKIVERFAGLGDRISCCARSKHCDIDAANAGDFYYAPCDVSDRADVSSFIDAAVDRLGAVDVLVNNAGIARDRSIALMAPEEWDLVVRTNLYGVFNFCNLVALSMMRRGGGVILNISSVAGVTGNRGQANYSAAKGGVNTLTRTLARELGPSGGRVNAIAPGFIETDMTVNLSEAAQKAARSAIPLRRFGTVDEVASVATFLCSPEAGYINGQVLRVDGGMVL